MTFFKRPAVWIVLPAIACLALALATRSALWATTSWNFHTRSGTEHSRGRDLLVLGSVFLGMHALIGVLKEHRDQLPFFGESKYGEEVVAVAVLDALSVGCLYVVAISAWLGP